MIKSKSLANKILLSVLAAGVFYLPACAAAAELTNDDKINAVELTIDNTITTAAGLGEQWYHTYDTITDGKVDQISIYYDYSDALTDDFTISGNRVNINGYNGTFIDGLYGVERNESKMDTYGAYLITDKNINSIQVSKNAVILKDDITTPDISRAYYIGAVLDFRGVAQNIQMNDNFVEFGSKNLKNNFTHIYVYGANLNIGNKAQNIQINGNSAKIGDGNDLSKATEIKVYGYYGQQSKVNSSEKITSGNLEVTNNSVVIGDNNIIGAVAEEEDAIINIYGAFADKRADNHTELSRPFYKQAKISDNFVSIGKGNKFQGDGDKQIMAAYVYLDRNTDVTMNGNYVNIDGGEFEAGANNEVNNGVDIEIAATIFGRLKTVTASENVVNINGGTFNGYTKITALMNIDYNKNETYTDNAVNISGGTFNGDTTIAPFWGLLSPTDGGTGTYTGNAVKISGGEFNGDTTIAAADVGGECGETIENNTLTITGNAGGADGDLSNADLYGWYCYYGYNNVNPSDNKLIIDGWSGTAKSINRFDGIEFANVKDGMHLHANGVSGMSDTPVTIVSLAATDEDLASLARPGEGADTPAGVQHITQIGITQNIYDAIGYSQDRTSGADYDDGSVDGIGIGGDLANSLNAGGGTAWITGDDDKNGTGGIYVNQVSDVEAYKDDTNGYSIKVEYEVLDNLLVGKFIDVDGTEKVHSGNTTGEAVLTVDNESFDTNARLLAGVYSAATGDKADASGGVVNVVNGTVDKPIYGGYSVNGDASGNEVILSGGMVTDDIYGGYSESGSANDNTVILRGTADVTNANLHGGGSGATVTISGNKLDIDGWSGTANSVNDFDSIGFTNLSKSDNPILTVTTPVDLNGVDVNVTSFAGGQTFEGGYTMTLIDKGETGTFGTAEKPFTAAVGVSQEVSGVIKQESDDTVILRINDTKLNPQVDLITQTNAAAGAFVIHGTDLINYTLDTLGRDEQYGVKTFATVRGSKDTYDVADDVKINGWTVIAGVGSEQQHKGGDFAWGAFYENGSGSYRAFNQFENEMFRTDGNMVYNGGGIAARYENRHNVYMEGSLRAGLLKNELKNALHDANGNSYSSKTESPYYGAHIGVGRIYKLDDITELDVYAKYFHTYVYGDDITIAGDKFDFDHITSDRLRVGARTNKQQGKVTTYYGLAYEYEFNGNVDTVVQGLRAERQSLRGGSGMAELGFNYKPGADSPWNFDLDLRGYVGARKGGSFKVQATYSF